MTDKEVYKSSLEKIFKYQCYSIDRAFFYIKSHQFEMSNEFIKAERSLTDSEKNDIVLSVLEGVINDSRY